MSHVVYQGVVLYMWWYIKSTKCHVYMNKLRRASVSRVACVIHQLNVTYIWISCICAWVLSSISESCRVCDTSKSTECHIYVNFMCTWMGHVVHQWVVSRMWYIKSTECHIYMNFMYLWMSHVVNQWGSTSVSVVCLCLCVFVCVIVDEVGICVFVCDRERRRNCGFVYFGVYEKIIKI